MRYVSDRRNRPRRISGNFIKVGNGTEGAHNIRLHCDGGSIPGIIEVGSNKTYIHGHDTVAWSFAKMMLAPRPDLVSFLGEGQHPALSWSACENVKLDQVRGGQAGNYSFDARKAFAVPTQGQYLIDTRSAGYGQAIGTRVGKRFVIPLPQTGRNANYMGGTGRATVAQLGLSVWIENPTLTENATTRVQQFSDGTFATPLGPAADIPAGYRGLYFVHQFSTQPNNITNGEIFVEITKAATGEWSEGVLIFEYFPYLGA
ncbi:MAG TPA: hypothetical protein VF592_01935 [Sphingomonas sp.]|jgi:hypothetical protein|uniref:hypothetical protein n=1 Tax=Sphingomonas sp. TaxID=28214 RepID=UPI002EDAEE88